MILIRVVAIVSVTAALVACRDEGRVAPSPTVYAWPDSFAFKMEYVAESRSDSALVVRYEERKELRFAVHDDRYLVWHDSVVKETLGPRRPTVVEPYAPEDTLPYYVELSRRGQVARAEPGCDPALPACREALPSALPLELLRLIPRLPVWSPPKGSEWKDTLVFDDTPRPRGGRGSVVTSYRVAGDTVVAGTPLWTVLWRSTRRTYGMAPGLTGMTVDAPVEETGLVYIDKDRELPVFATWAGGMAAPPALRALGVTGTGFRGRAYLAGSIVERLLAPPQ
jgi:hypothetical protein